MNIDTIHLGLGKPPHRAERAGSIIFAFASAAIVEHQSGVMQVEVLVNDEPKATLNINFSQAGPDVGGHAGAAPGTVPFVQGDLISTRVSLGGNGNAAMRFAKLSHAVAALYSA